MKKIGFILLLSLFSSFMIVGNVQAKDKHVSDCLDAQEDCQDDIQSSKDIEEDGDTSTEITEMKTGSLFFNIVKMIIALLLVLGLIYLLLLFLKKKNNLFHKAGVMENIGGLSVGSQKSIQIIRIGEAMYIIGVGDNVEMLQEITDETVKRDLLEKKEATVQTPNFLQSILKSKQPKVSDRTNPTFTSRLQEELDNLKKNRHQMMDEVEKREDNDKYV